MRKVFFAGLIGGLLALVSSSLSAKTEPVPSPTDEPTGLSLRALPEREVIVDGTRNLSDLPTLNLGQPFYQSIFYIPRQPDYYDNSLSNYRVFTTFVPPQGLYPLHPKVGLSTLTLNAGFSQTYDSNLLLTPENKIADLYNTVFLQAEHQLGTPDSIYLTDGYETLTALHTTGRFFEDLFWRRTDLDSANTDLRIDGRVGRNTLFFRPSLEYSDITSTGLATFDGSGRIRRQQLSASNQTDYSVSPFLLLHQRTTFTVLNHSEFRYINTQSIRALQEAEFKVSRDLGVLSWVEYHQTAPSIGAFAQESVIGLGWRGKLEDRLYSDFKLGWDFLSVREVVGRKNLSGVRLNGATTFDYTQRTKFILRYNRSYTYNEFDRDDNYVSTQVGIGWKSFLGGNWTAQPDLSISHSEFETSHRETVEYRPEFDLSYSLNAASRCFIKPGYVFSETIHGSGRPMDGIRISLGINYAF